MNHLIGYSLFLESKNYQPLYHILDLDKLKYVIENNHLKPYLANNGGMISFTRDKLMNSYLGDSPTSFFKLEVDAEKISQNYKIKPFSYISKTKVRFDEREEVVKTNKGVISDLNKYVTKLIIIKSALEKLKQNTFRDETPTDFYTTAGTRLGTIPEIIKYVVETSPYEIYVQEGSVIKKDDVYINSIINYELHEVYFRYDIWYRGYFKRPSFRFGEQDTLIDDYGNRYIDWVVGTDYDKNLKTKDKDELNLDVEEKIIDGVKCEPYIIKFRVTKKGYYMEDVRPLSWLDPNLFFENEPINEWVSNKKLSLYHIKDMIRKIQKASKNKIINSQLKKETDSNRILELDFRDIIDHKIFEKILKQYQKNLINKGILISYRKREETDSNFEPETLEMSNTRLNGKMNFKIYIKDMYTQRVKPPRYIFHYSKEKHRDSILKNGLKAIHFDDGNWTTEGENLCYPPSVFAMKDTSTVWSSDKYVIDTNGLSNKWWKDLNFYSEHNKTSAIMTFSDIPAEHIRLSNKHVYDYKELFK